MISLIFISEQVELEKMLKVEIFIKMNILFPFFNQLAQTLLLIQVSTLYYDVEHTYIGHFYHDFNKIVSWSYLRRIGVNYYLFKIK